ncbi:cytidine deaminase [Ureaplasma diversum]|uniref:Cytidine deaminase n=1 Tax=Ureaplasma diversum NCTC 246 TaxID=1188241 RepID=A0A084EZE0_9BACT|nr:cytidine deaminase [Ureaplasma diversum]KEZ23332.1 Cytidine deaminase (Cytidine aminohydrolase) [Ureaplasma diversum NCTC 246]
MEIKEIFAKLKELLNNSYCVYSNYPVGAIIETDKGYFNGVNVENGSFGLTICAERNAIGAAISNGAKEVKTVYVLTKDLNDTGTPCGACRQVISEFANEQAQVYIINYDGSYKSYHIDQLIPYKWSAKKSL